MWKGGLKGLCSHYRLNRRDTFFDELMKTIQVVLLRTSFRTARLSSGHVPASHLYRIARAARKPDRRLIHGKAERRAAASCTFLLAGGNLFQFPTCSASLA